MLFSIIIINYRQKEFAEKCINSIKTHFNFRDYELILVNNSPEEKIEIDGVRVIENTNKGFSHASNLAAETAEGKYLFFLNADTVFEKNFTEIFKRNFADKEFGAVGLGMKNPGGTFQLSFWKENTFLNEIKNKRREKEFRHGSTKIPKGFNSAGNAVTVDWVSGAAIIIPAEVFRNIKGFDEEFFLFYEDADICKRITDKGLKVFYMPFDGLVHFKGENVNPDFLSETYYYSKVSEILYYKKHNSLFQRVILRVYLFSRFLFLSYKGKLYRRILKMVTGLEK